MKYVLSILVLISSLNLVAQDSSQSMSKTKIDTVYSSNLLMGMSVSTFGTGIFITKNIYKNIKVKASGNYIFYNYSLNKLISDLEGKAKLRVGGIGLFADWNFYRFIFFSAGASTNFNKVDVNGQMANSIMIGDIEMTPEEIGKVGIKVEPSWAISPYVGIGFDFGKRLFRNNKIAFSSEIGTFFQGRPNVDLSATGMLTPTASTEQEILIENNLKPFDFWPKLAINITYKLN